MFSLQYRMLFHLNLNPNYITSIVATYSLLILETCPQRAKDTGSWSRP
jgi:hypothetical protein